MDFLFIIVIWLAAFTVILAIFSLIITYRKKIKIKNKLNKIDSESKLLAIDELRRIIKKDSYNFQAREKLADFLIENKSYLPAIKEYLVILDHFQNNPKIDELKYLNKIGQTYLNLQNYDEAKKYFLIVKSKDDMNFTANINLAEIEMSNNNYEKAENYFNIASQILPDDIELLKPYALCQYNLNKFNQAIIKFEKYLKEKGEDSEVDYYLSYSFYNLSRFDDSIKYFNKLKKSDEYKFEAFYMLGIIHLDQDIYNVAIEDFNNALLSGKNLESQKILEINYNLAESHLKAHNITLALEHWKKVADIEPGYKDVQAKIENYSQVATNSLLETYLVGSINQFIKICQLIVKYYITHFSVLKGGNVNFLDIKTTPASSLEILSEVTSGNFIETYFFVFMRSTTSIGDMALRTMYNNLKEKKADKGICITAGTFTDSAKEFVESRMLKIVEREKLMEILNKIGQSLRTKNR